IALRFGFVLPLRSRRMITLTGALTGLKCETSCLTPSSLTTKSSSFRSVNGRPSLSIALTFRLTSRVSMRMAPGHGAFGLTSVIAGAAEESSAFASVVREGLFTPSDAARDGDAGFASAVLPPAAGEGAGLDDS